MRHTMSKLSSLMFVFAICLLGVSAKPASPTPCPDVSFDPPTYFQNGLGTNGLATGDLNGDGNADLAAANEGSGTVTVRFGDGTGAFPSSQLFFVTTPSSVAIADLNRDGILDLVSSSRSINRITVMLGLGGGAFAAAVQTTVGSSPSGVATGDFNGDGNIDIVTANAGNSTVSLLLGNPAGSFPAATSFSNGRRAFGPFGLVVADFNGDGKRDVATANRGSASISVLSGDGSGGFVSVVYPAGAEPSNITTGDLNGDSKLDIVTANFGSNNLTIRINDGLGGFLPAVTLASGVETLSVAMGDLDNDGKTDIVATNRGSTNLSVFRGNGDGSFAPRKDFAVRSGPRALIVGDLNDDDGIDIATGIDSGATAVLLNACSANSPPTISAGIVTRQQDSGSSNSMIGTVGDEQDDPADLAVTVNGGASASVNGVTVSNIDVNPAGNVTADVSAACAASDTMFTLAVTDSEGVSATATLGVVVTSETTPPVINKGNPIPDVTVQVPLNSPDLSMPVTFDLPMAADNCSASPTVTTSPVSGSTFNAGSTLVTVTAKDALNNTSTATFRVNVLFNFGGLLSPIDPFPALNTANGGSSIPLKFSLSGYKGMNILAPGYPASSLIACDQNQPGLTLEETASAGGEGLTYDASSDQYKYVWKTSKTWKGTCRILVLRLADGSEHYAKFSFK